MKNCFKNFLCIALIVAAICAIVYFIYLKREEYLDFEDDFYDDEDDFDLDEDLHAPDREYVPLNKANGPTEEEAEAEADSEE